MRLTNGSFARSITIIPCSLLPLCTLKSEAEIPNAAAKILMRVILHKSSNLAHLDQDQEEEGLQIKLYLSNSYFFYEMDPRHDNFEDLRSRSDEYDINFEYAA
jgi:hypothetical protein